MYASDGGQIVSPADKQITEYFRNLKYQDLPRNINELAESQIDAADLIEEEIYSSYLTNLENENFVSTSTKDLSVLYSPLHGTGAWCFEQAYKKFGYKNYQTLASEADPDGHFTGLKSANPEEQAAFIGLLKEAEQSKPDLLLATDPDADRMGCAVRQDNGYTFLTGNQIGALLLDWTARKGADQRKNPFICKTIVTSEFQSHIARSYGMRVVETLTGFKHIAGAIEKDPSNYVFGGEESYGYLPVTWVRDKDSISAALALTEMAAEASLPDQLAKLQIEHGLYHEELKNLVFGQHELEKMGELMKRLKDAASFTGSMLAERTIIDVLDLHENGIAPVTPYCQGLRKELPAASVYQFHLEPEGRVTIRPSGTEPKVKIYVSLRHQGSLSSENLESCRAKLAEESQKILEAFLKIVGA